MQIVPLFGSGVFGKSAVVTRQRRLNCYYELRPDADKGAKVVVYGTPGLSLIATLSSPLNTPVRGWVGSDSALYVVVANQFLSLSAAYATLFSGAITSAQGQVSIAMSPSNTGTANQVMLVDGSAGWVYSPNAGTFVQNTAAWFIAGSRTITNIGGYFVTEQAGTPNFNVSNLNDALNGSALSVGAASAYPDVLSAVDNLSGNLVLFGMGHMEFWQPVGTPPPAQPFANVQAATNEWGLAAVFSRAHVDQGLAFLGQTRQGSRHVCMLRGYQVETISEEIDAIINAPGFLYSDATAMTFQVDKHPFYEITFPSMGRTFLYDLSTGIWNELQTGLTTDGQYRRHRASLSTYHRGQTIVSDYQNGNVYTLDPTKYTDNGEPIPREVITRHATKGFNRFRVPFIYLDMETGVGTSTGVDSDVNPIISIECSKNNGRSWLLARMIALGALGKYLTRVAARRWGQARVFTWRIRMTAACKFVITNGAIEVRGKASTK